MQQWSITVAVYYYYSPFIIKLQILSPQTPDLKMHNTEYNSTDDIGRLFSLASSHFQVLGPTHPASLQGCFCETDTSVSGYLSSAPACWCAWSEQSSRFGWIVLRSNRAKVWICQAWNLLPPLGRVILCNSWQRGRVRIITACHQGYKKSKCQKYGLWCTQDNCQPFEVVKPKPYIFSSVPHP